MYKNHICKNVFDDTVQQNPIDLSNSSNYFRSYSAHFIIGKLFFW